MTGLPRCHALAVIAKANLRVYDFVHPMYKADRQRRIYNQVVHPMGTHEMVTVDDRTGRVMAGDELDDDYSRYILPLVMDDSLHDPHQSTKSHKRKAQDPAGVPNVMKLDIHGGHAEILVPISILIMKGMLWQWRIYWMVHGYPVVVVVA